MASVDDMMSWIREHRVASGVIAVLAVAVILLGLGVANMAVGGLQNQFSASESLAYDRAVADGSRSGVVGPDGSGGSGEFVEVKEAHVDIESEDAEASSMEARGLVEGYEGYVEQSRKSESDLYINVHLTVRVPVESFDSFVGDLRSQFDVESYNVRDFRLPIQRELDELEIINRTLNDLEDVREDVREMEASKEKAELLVTIAEKELEMKRKQREFERDLSDKQKRGDMATVYVTIQQRKRVDIAPENIGNRFRNEVKDMVDNVVTTSITTLTDGVELLFKAFKWVVFAVIVAVPFGLAYKGVRAIYRRYWT